MFFYVLRSTRSLQSMRCGRTRDSSCLQRHISPTGKCATPRLFVNSNDFHDKIASSTARSCVVTMVAAWRLKAVKEMMSIMQIYQDILLTRSYHSARGAAIYLCHASNTLLHARLGRGMPGKETVRIRGSPLLLHHISI